MENGKIYIGVRLLKDQYKKDVKQLINDTEKYAGEVEKSTENLGFSSDRFVKKLKIAGATILGIVGSITTIGESLSRVISQDKQLASNLNYLKFVAETMINNIFLAIGNKLKPLLEYIVDLAFRLLNYINYIANAWFGVNLFANATADAFKKQSTALAKTGKEAKALEKTLLGFDKINKLDSQKNSGSGGGAGGGTGFTMPTMDIPQGKIPEWVQWIADNKDKVIKGLIGIAGGLIAVKLGASGIQGIGIGVSLMGITGLIEDLPGYIEKLNSTLDESGTTWEQFGDILDDASLGILGVGIATQNLPLVIIGAFGLILATVMKYWDETKEILKTAENWIWEQLDKLEIRLGIFGTIAKGIFSSVRDFIVDYFKGIFKPIKNVVDGILLIFKGDLEGGIKTIGKGIVNYLISVINRLVDGINLIATPLRAMILVVGKVLGKSWTMDNIKIPRVNYLARGGIIVNRPGQGVPVGNAYAGEVSREGVLPLTDESAMSRLGLEIGKHVTVNADVTLELERRVLARVMKEIQGDNAFLGNGV